MSVVEATERDLENFDERLPGIKDSSLAATALSLARRLDNERTAATAYSMIARELREHIGQLRAMCPPEETNDEIDELRARRDARRAAARAAAGGAGT